MSAVRKWLRILHRDIGYLAIILTVIFSISGIAVNHIDDWNPNYGVSYEEISIVPVRGSTKVTILAKVLPQLGLEPGQIRNAYRSSPEQIEIFTDEGTFSINIKTGIGIIEKVSKRFLLFDFNYLHLNSGRDSWKWFSDLFALSLIFLAVSGLFLIKGKKGIKWRGTILTVIGLLLPIIYIIYYRLN